MAHPLQYAVQWFLVGSQRCAAIITAKFRTSPSPQTKPKPTSRHCPALQPPPALASLPSTSWLHRRACACRLACQASPRPRSSSLTSLPERGSNTISWGQRRRRELSRPPAICPFPGPEPPALSAGASLCSCFLDSPGYTQTAGSCGGQRLVWGIRQQTESMACLALGQGSRPG